MMIDTADNRFAKANAIADQAAGWAKCRTRDGRKSYGIPSSKGDGRFYLVTQTSCDCEDQRRRPGLACKHRIALAIHVARLTGKPMPASDTIDGLTQMVSEQRLVLDMVRHPDGEISWSRHERVTGETVYLPRHRATAGDYDRIFGKEA